MVRKHGHMLSSPLLLVVHQDDPLATRSGHHGARIRGGRVERRRRVIINITIARRTAVIMMMMMVLLLLMMMIATIIVVIITRGIHIVVHVQCQRLTLQSIVAIVVTAMVKQFRSSPVRRHRGTVGKHETAPATARIVSHHMVVTR